MNYIKSSLFCLLVLSALVFFKVSSHAALTKQLSYQGRLQDASGNPVANGTYSITLSIYNAPTGGSPLYTETQNVAVDKGGFSVYIGSVTPLNLPFNEDYFLGMQVGSDPEMTPRLKLSVVGASVFALDAGNAANFGGQPPSSFAPSTHAHDSQYSATTHTHNVVTQIIAGSNVTISPAGGTGVVTINASGGGGGGTPASTVTSVGASNVVGTSTNYAREDHAHSIPAGLITDAMVNASAAIAKSKLNLTNSILFTDIAQNGCASGQVVEWNGTSWVCGTDDTTGGGAVVNNPSATQTIVAGNSTTTPIIAKGAAGTSVPMFEVQDSSGAQKFAVMPDGHVFVPSTNQLHVLNVNNDSPTGPMGDMTIDVNGTGNTKLILTNSNASRVADLAVEGAVLVGNPAIITAKVSSYETGTTNYAGYFEIFNTANGNNALYVTSDGTAPSLFSSNSGTGRASTFNIGNAGNSSAVILGNTAGTGNLLQLQQGGVDKFLVNNLGRINTASVDTGSIMDSTILFADVAANGCAGGQVMKYNGMTSAWECAADASGSGTMTSITAGTGLSGGTITTSGTIGILAGGVGATELAAGAVAGGTGGVISDSTIIDADIAAGANIAATKIATGTFAVLNPAANQTVLSGGAAVTPLIVKAAAAPTANIFDVQGNAGNSFVKVDASGFLLVGGPATTAKVSVYETGTNKAAYFETNNAGNSFSLITGNIQSGTGNLLQLQKSAVDKFVVGNAGDVVMSKAGTSLIDVKDAGNTVLNITNSDAIGTASLQVEGSNVVTATTGVVTNPAAAQTIQPTADVVPLIIKDDAAATANLFDVQTNAGASLVKVNPSGNLLVGNPTFTTAKISVEETGTANFGGYFNITNATNSNAAVRGDTSGTGNAGGFVINNAANANALILGNLSAGTGPLLKLQQAGVDKFVVSNTGSVGIGTASPVATIDFGTMVNPGIKTAAAAANIVLDATDAAATKVSVTNSGAGIAALEVEGGIVLGVGAGVSVNLNTKTDPALVTINVQNPGAGNADLQVEGKVTAFGGLNTVPVTDGAALKLIQSGLKAPGVASCAPAALTTAVAFPVAFLAAPDSVTVTPAGINATNAKTVWVENVTTTGFDIKCGDAGASVTVDFYWMAIGNK